MASQRQHAFNPNDAAALDAGEAKTSLISFSEPTRCLALVK